MTQPKLLIPKPSTPKPEPQDLNRKPQISANPNIQTRDWEFQLLRLRVMRVHHIILDDIILLYDIASYYAVLYCTVAYYSMLYYMIVYCIILYFIMKYHGLLSCIILCCFAQHSVIPRIVMLH